MIFSSGFVWRPVELVQVGAVARQPYGASYRIESEIRHGVFRNDQEESAQAREVGHTFESYRYEQRPRLLERRRQIPSRFHEL
jgi:hypothetical protein